jgi:uncharacterized surface protein with fasciclin (FAS1) repeats
MSHRGRSGRRREPDHGERISAPHASTHPAAADPGGEAAGHAADAEGTEAVTGAKFVQTDIVASNGVIHAIDAVLLPKGTILAAAA